MPTQAPVLGIDLGTTFSLVGAVQAGHPVLFPNAVGELLTPSAVSVDEDGQVLVGAAARARAVTHPELTAVAFKRDMGTDQSYRLGDANYRPEELAAAVLGSLRHDAEQALGMTVEEAVITVPAYFGDLQRQATRDAGDIAGLKVERIINEPTAAALAYGLHSLDRELKAVVLDVGGGTFDVTVLEIIEGVIEVQSTAGDSRLGGEDFVSALLALVAQRIARRHDAAPDPGGKTVARLREACEVAKRRLTDQESVLIALPAVLLEGGRTVDVALEITQPDASEVWRPVLDRLQRPISRALRDARLGVSDIDEVLLVGGATRMPCIVELAAKHFNRLPHRELPPDEAVAQGAAIQGALKQGDESVADLVVTDVAPFTLGLSTGTKIGRRTVEGMFSPLIERGTVIPASRIERYFPLDDNQRQLEIEVYQGEHSTCNKNTALGSFTLPLPRRGDANQKAVDVRFTYDLNGILEVEMTVVATGEKHHLVIEQRPGALSRRELEAARRRMAALKFHPRESLPNRTALARADAMFTQLSGEARSFLSQRIAAFRAALENQAPGPIDQAREELNAVVDMLSRQH